MEGGSWISRSGERLAFSTEPQTSILMDSLRGGNPFSFFGGVPYAIQFCLWNHIAHGKDEEAFPRAKSGKNVSTLKNVSFISLSLENPPLPISAFWDKPFCSIQSYFCGMPVMWICLIYFPWLEAGEMFLARIPHRWSTWGASHVSQQRPIIDLSLTVGATRFDHLVQLVSARSFHWKATAVT